VATATGHFIPIVSTLGHTKGDCQFEDTVLTPLLREDKCTVSQPALGGLVFFRVRRSQETGSPDSRRLTISGPHGAHKYLPDSDTFCAGNTPYRVPDKLTCHSRISVAPVMLCWELVTPEASGHSTR